MRADSDAFAAEQLPCFLEQAEELKAYIQGLDYDRCRTLWQCNDAIAALNFERFQTMDLHGAQTPALFAYDGIQYQYMAPNVFTEEELSYVKEHLRILSGFYGLLRPFDGVVPYRLEMQARLAVDGARDLYRFWGGDLARQLAAETGLVVNLASREYSRAVEPHLPPEVRFVTCTFGEWQDGKVVEKGTLCKMARGQMVRWMAENAVTCREELRGFSQLGYRFSPELYGKNNDVFLLENPDNAPWKS